MVDKKVRILLPIECQKNRMRCGLPPIKQSRIPHLPRAGYNGFQMGIVLAQAVLGIGILHQQVLSGCHRNACMDSRTLPLVTSYTLPDLPPAGGEE